MIDWLFVAAGLTILVFGGNFLVSGASSLALRLGIPVLIVGLTVVAFGTSAPELIVSLRAALDGQTDLALGNIVGSNIANILLILGLPAVISTIRTGDTDSTRSYVAMLLTAVLFIGLSLTGSFGWWQALILLAGLAWFILDNIRIARRHPEQVDEAMADEYYEVLPWWRIGALIVAGLVGLAVGADLLVQGAVNIARTFGVPEAVIGLTLVAIGTSLPELVTSLVAAIKGEAEVALGNVIGSNTFNILAIVGITGVIHPLPVPPAFFALDLWVMLGASLLIAPFILWRLHIGRVAGAGLVGLYVAYTAVLVL